MVKKLLVLGHSVQVRYDADLDRLNELGNFTHSPPQITIGPHRGDNPDEVRSTLFHEALHAALAFSGWSELLKQIGADAEEGLVRLLESEVPKLYAQCYEGAPHNKRGNRKGRKAKGSSSSFVKPKS
jgi:hypothetical protein